VNTNPLQVQNRWNLLRQRNEKTVIGHRSVSDPRRNIQAGAAFEETVMNRIGQAAASEF
jgi:hypothetical protein